MEEGFHPTAVPAAAIPVVPPDETDEIPIPPDPYES
jgi:hypothetical protein